MKLVNVNKISYDPKTKGYLVLLKSYKDDDFLEIMVGAKSAKQISLAKEGVKLPRPCTHELLLDIVNSFDIKFRKIIITDYRSSTFFAKIVLFNINLGQLTIDSRPSDAIILSLRTDCPLYMSTKILKSDKIILKEEHKVSYKTTPQIEKEDSPEVLLANLNRALDNAILSEEYEIAAKLRDKIKALS